MSVEPEYIGIDDSFTFTCSPEVTCFNQCCMDVNQFLYPYDIIRLKSHLCMTSTEFLDNHAIIYSGDTTGLPVVSFRTSPMNGHACPFVTEKGCGVYENRPASCRIFPLARAISRARSTGEISEHFALIKDPVCNGFKSGRSIRVRDWVIGQGLLEYNEANDRMIELVSLKQQIMPGPLSGTEKEKFILACYDVDRFRSAIDNDGLVKEDDIGKGRYLQIMANDKALLDFGMEWVAGEIFGRKAQK
jgi:Fe-S-cluster containining protein